MVVSKKELSVNKSISLPLSQVVRLSEIADAEKTDFSSIVARLIKLGLVYQRVLADQSENEEIAYVESLQKAKVAQ